MSVEFPYSDWLMHNQLEQLTPAQRSRYDAMVQLSDLLNRTVAGATERTTGRCQPMLFTAFLDRLYRAVMEQDSCEHQLLIDDFVRIARFSLPAVKHIINSPSTRLEKNAEKVSLPKLRQTTADTMRWMARRPGRSAAEKIAPQNKVLTKVTHFSANTRENQELMYLYKILYDVIRVRTAHAPCADCPHPCERQGKELLELLTLNIKVRRGPLREVPPVRQTVQNNKLMCDKFYKMVWDAVGELSTVEQKLRCDWERVEERYLRVGFWIVLAVLLHDTQVAVYDVRGALYDREGELWFGEENGPGLKAWEVLLFPLRRPEEPLLLRLTGGTVLLEDAASQKNLICWDLGRTLYSRYDFLTWEE